MHASRKLHAEHYKALFNTCSNAVKDSLNVSWLVEAPNVESKTEISFFFRND